MVNNDRKDKNMPHFIDNAKKYIAEELNKQKDRLENEGFACVTFGSAEMRKFANPEQAGRRGSDLDIVESDS